MNKLKFLSTAIVLALVVVAVGCTPMSELNSRYPERPVNNRIYVEDPYRGTIVLERDPYTGRYYEVNTFGNYYGNRYYRNHNRYGGYYRGWRNNGQYQTPKPPTQEQIRDREKNKKEARDKILGN